MPASSKNPFSRSSAGYYIIALIIVFIAAIAALRYYQKSMSAKAVLLIKVDPPSAQIELNGRLLKDTGETRLIEGLPPGPAVLLSRNPFCLPQKKTVLLKKGEIAEVHLELRCSRTSDK
jgi:hypothetical protein